MFLLLGGPFYLCIEIMEAFVGIVFFFLAGLCKDWLLDNRLTANMELCTNRLLSNLTQALQNAGVDLSQANISVKIDLGKRANRGLTSETSTKV